MSGLEPPPGSVLSACCRWTLAEGGRLKSEQSFSLKDLLWDCVSLGVGILLLFAQRQQWGWACSGISAGSVDGV